MEAQARLRDDLDDPVTHKCRARVKGDIDNLEGLLNLLDQVILALRDLYSS